QSGEERRKAYGEYLDSVKALRDATRKQLDDTLKLMSGQSGLALGFLGLFPASGRNALERRYVLPMLQGQRDALVGAAFGETGSDVDSQERRQGFLQQLSRSRRASRKSWARIPSGAGWRGPGRACGCCSG